jgi:RecA/RadA recombinase
LAETINTALQGRMVRVGAQAEARLPALSSGFAALDAATGMDGFPRGRLTELIGRATSGRGTVAARAMAAIGGQGAWIDVSGTVDVGYLAESGVDLNRLFVLRPARPADTLGIAAHLMASGHFELVVLDALPDLATAAPATALGSELSRFTRILGPALARTATAGLLLSGPEHHFRALAHAAALRIGLQQVSLIRRGGVFRGWRTRATILKSPGLQGGESGIEVWL